MKPENSLYHKPVCQNLQRKTLYEFSNSFTGYQCLHQRACDLDNPSYPTLKKEMQKPSQQNIEDLLFDDLFSADSIDGQNVIKTNSDVSLCKKASQLCCHPKATPPPSSLRLPLPRFY